MNDNSFTRMLTHPLVRTVAIAAGWALLGQGIKELTALHDHPWARILTEVAINVRLVLLASPFVRQVITTTTEKPEEAAKLSPQETKPSPEASDAK